MGFSIEDLKRPPSGAMYVSPERICVTADGELTDENDPAAVRLIVAKGGEMPAAEAAQYGLIETDEPSLDQPEAAADSPAAGEDPAADGDEVDAPRRRKR